MDPLNYFKNFDYKDLNSYKQIAFVLLVIGGVNLGLMGLVNLNLIEAIFGMFLGRLFLIFIGAAAGYECYLYYQEKFVKKPPRNAA